MPIYEVNKARTSRCQSTDGHLEVVPGPWSGATAKARSPSVDLRVAGTIRSADETDRRW